MADDEQIEEVQEEQAPQVVFSRCDGSGESAGVERMGNLTEGVEYGRCPECSLMAPVSKAGKLKVHERPGT